MNWEDLVSYDILISSNNMLSKVEKEKELQIFLTASKIEYATLYWSCSFDKIK